MLLVSPKGSMKGSARGLAAVMVLAATGSWVGACWDRGGDQREGERAAPDGSASSRDSGGTTRVGPRPAGRPGEVDVSFTIHTRRDVKDISPFIYGVNTHCSWEGKIERPGMIRLGGNRWTAYNWANNASNAGSDYRHQNDGWLGGGDRRGEAIRSRVAGAHEFGAAALVTVPMAGYVAADKRGGGDVSGSGRDYLETRFLRSLPRKEGEYQFPPDTGDGKVYQDEMVYWLENECSCPRDEKPIFYALDNEPCLWATTHARVWPGPVTYSELVERSIAYSRAIKDVAPEALVFGPVSYGWMGFTNLQNAPDADGRNFLEVYLDSMREASEQEGRRLLDVLTVHWYPEARGGGRRITSESTSEAAADARVQAPRSLWDPAYLEDSWISTRALSGPIHLLPRLRATIEEHYPGTKLAVTEYHYGGGGHISGGIAQADVLGILGRESVFAASVWTFGKGESDYLFGAMNMFMDYDGEGSAFGDRSVHAVTDDSGRTSVYAGLDGGNPGRMVVVAINKSRRPLVAGMRITHDRVFDQARAFRISDDSPTPSRVGDIPPAADNAFRLSLPAMSVTTIELGSGRE